MSLPRAENALKNLIAWLDGNGYITDPQGFAIEHSPEQDAANANDPRAFCFVTPGEGIIYCTQNLENLPDRALVGILLHEIGHIHLGAFDGDEAEVDVDEWATKIEEAGYHYEDIVYQRDGHAVLANNIEVVYDKFAFEILR